MPRDKFSATWVSHSSISDYLKCPRAYYLKNVYRDPQTRRKVSIMQPSLALGQVVHTVLESLSLLPASDRFDGNLVTSFEKYWEGVAGERGGFTSELEEEEVKARGIKMLERVMNHRGPLQTKAVKIKQELPYFWISEEDNIILCGKIDWLEFIPDGNSVHIIDFKTGKNEEDPESLQLPIYYLLARNCQTWPVSKMSYWYLDRDDSPTSVNLPEASEAEKQILTIAKKIALARKLNHFPCSSGGDCRFCFPLESIVRKQAKCVGQNDFGQDIYILSR